MNILDTLRIVHLIFGIYLAGSYLFFVPILEPRLRRLGPAIQGPVMSALMPILFPVNAASFVIVVGTGVVMTLNFRAGGLDTLFATGWGWAMVIGLFVTLAAIVVGFGFLAPKGIIMDKLGHSMAGRPPTSQEGKRLQELSAQVETLSKINLVLVVIALVSMLIARYV